MNKKQKHFFLILSLVLLLIVVSLAGIRYLPFHKFLKVSSVPESEFKNPGNRIEVPNTLFCDFEVDPKTGNTNGLYQGIAHSGQFSTKAFGKNSYSIAIERAPGEISCSHINAVGLSAWVYVFPTDKEIIGSYVFSANNDLGINICWKSVGVTGQGIPQGKWFKISGHFDLSDIKWKPNYKIQVYFWNNSNTDMLVDDYYIVFGAAPKRKGDTTLTDMTSVQPFQPRFNYPPFPLINLEKEEINNRNSVYLINDGDDKTGDISPNDQLFAGNFTGNNDGRDDLLVIKSTGNCELYHFCDEKSRFSKIKTIIPPDLLTFFSRGKVIQGKFTGAVPEELLIIKDKELLIGSFDKIKIHCSSNTDDQTPFKTIIRVKEKDLPALNTASGNRCFSADVDGDKQSELLIINDNGSWDLFKYSSSTIPLFKSIASGKENSIPEWNLKDFTCTINTGRFLSAIPNDLILTTSRNKETKMNGFSLLKFTAGLKQFGALFPEKYHFPGKTIGLDTLKTGDQFFSGLFDNTGRNRIFRYNRDWRYDLKEIRFNDSTFQILSNIDFNGFEKDHNPKYYEELRIVKGCFLQPEISAFLVIAQNHKKLASLPNSIQFYSYPKPVHTSEIK